MEAKSHIYVLEVEYEYAAAGPEFILCMNKEEVEAAIIQRSEAKSLTVHEGQFDIKYSTKPEIKVYW